LLFLGRKDQQIKLNGYRIELGEIESALSEVPGLKEVAVMLREDRPGMLRLVAYYNCHPNVALTSQQLRDALKIQLPEYMIPTAFILMTDMPLSSHGKVNLKALPPPESGPGESEETSAPLDELQLTISKIWCEVLGCAQVNTQDNFFDLGGNSLLILQIFKKLESILPAECQVIDLFKYPTIQSLAEFIASDKKNASIASEKINERVAKQKLATLKKVDRKRASMEKASTKKTATV
jgi:acyl carrier protein